MADDIKAGAAIEAAKALAAQFAAAVAAFAALGPDKEEASPPPATVSLSEATEEAKRARSKYDSLIKWAIGIFAGIGAIIFGSVPFANLTHIPLPPALVGLAFAGLGISFVVWGATRSWEPVDIGLGELQASTESVTTKPSSFWHPRAAADYRLRQIINAEPYAHLGPGNKNIAALIRRIKKLERSLLEAGGTSVQTSGTAMARVLNVGVADGPGVEKLQSVIAGTQFELTDRDIPDEEARSAAIQLESSGYVIIQLDPDEQRLRQTTDELLDDLLEYLSNRKRARSPLEWADIETQLTARLTLTKSVVEQLRDLAKDATSEQKEEVQEAIRRELETVGRLTAALPRLSELQSAGRVTVAKDKLDLYLNRRHLLLSEATVAQARALFVVARRWIGAGAILTLLGGVFYTYAIANPEDGLGVNTVVTARIDKDATAAWAVLVACADPADDATEVSDLKGVLTKTDNADGKQDGPFTVLIVSGACTEELLSVDNGQGFYTVVDPDATGNESADGTGGSDEPPAPPKTPVLVTLTARTAGWLAALDACEQIESDGDIADLRAYLVTPDTDANGNGVIDGPFTILVTDDRCDGATIEVEEDQGSYSPATS